MRAAIALGLAVVALADVSDTLNYCLDADKSWCTLCDGVTGEFRCVAWILGGRAGSRHPRRPRGVVVRRSSLSSSSLFASSRSFDMTGLAQQCVNAPRRSANA